jgi:hypothetical protein
MMQPGSASAMTFAHGDKLQLQQRSSEKPVVC